MFDDVPDPDDRGEAAANAPAGGVEPGHFGVKPDAFGSPEQRIAWVLSQPPSGATLAVLESLIDTVLTRRWRVLAAKAWERQRAAVTALSAAAKVTATVIPPMSDCTQDSADTELAWGLRRTDGEMRYELTHDRRLLRLSVLFGLLRRGECSVGHIEAFLHLTRDMLLDDVVAVDAAVGERAATMTVSGFRRVVRKAIARLDSRNPAEKRQGRRRKVGIRCHPEADGLVTIAATMPAADGIAMLGELNRRADALRAHDDPRSHGERQVDALLDAIGRSAPVSTAPAPGARDETRRRTWFRTEIQVLIDWRSLLGLTNDPGELVGYGPIPADDVRAMIAEPGTTLRRLVTDPVSGVLVDYGQTRYRPDAHLAGLIKARDVTCRAPGCTANAIYCDGDHCDPFPEGPTSAGNICQLCRGHHRRKTFDGFSYSRPDPATGETVWVTPLGFRYRQQPAFYDDAGADPGDTFPLDTEEADRRWVPPLPDPPSPSANHESPGRSLRDPPF